MSERSIIEAQLKKKTAEIQGFEEKLKAAKVYVKALEDVLKAIEKGAPDQTADGDVTLRRGSLVDRARDVILERGNPMHIDELLLALGRKVNRESKASLTGSIAAYVRIEEIFSRPAPSTFGLIELGHTESTESEESPPENFGFGPTSNEIDDDIPF